MTAEIIPFRRRPHIWGRSTGHVFYCLANCGAAFEFGVDPVPQGPCEPPLGAEPAPPFDFARSFIEILDASLL